MADTGDGALDLLASFAAMKKDGGPTMSVSVSSSDEEEPQPKKKGKKGDKKKGKTKGDKKKGDKKKGDKKKGDKKGDKKKKKKKDKSGPAPSPSVSADFDVSGSVDHLAASIPSHPTDGSAGTNALAMLAGFAAMKKPNPTDDPEEDDHLSVPGGDGARKSAGSNALAMLAGFAAMKGNPTDDALSVASSAGHAADKSAGTAALSMLAGFAAMKSGAPTDDPEEEKKAGADDALAMLGDFAAMKAGGAPPSGAAAAAPEMTPEVDEKTPPPPEDMSELEKRKFLLKFKRKKLERRKKQRERIRAARAGNKGDGAQGVFGTEYVQRFMKQLAKEQQLAAERMAALLQAGEDEKKEENVVVDDFIFGADGTEQKMDKSLFRQPGRLNTLSLMEDEEEANFGYIIERNVETAEKECMTDSTMFEDYLREEWPDQFLDDDNHPIPIDVKVCTESEGVGVRQRERVRVEQREYTVSTLKIPIYPLFECFPIGFTLIFCVCHEIR